MNQEKKAVEAIHAQFSVPGIKPEDIVLLFNTSNFDYYCRQVAQLRVGGVCAFCHIDYTFNEELPIWNPSWRVLRNTIAPRSGQSLQLVIPLKNRHVVDSIDLTEEEWVDLHRVYRAIRTYFNLQGCAITLRDGDPFFNAKSVRHIHVNIHVPTGIEKVQVTFGKELKKIEAKLIPLRIFEKMRLLKEAGNQEPWLTLEPHELEVVKDDIKPPVLLG